MKKKCNLSVLIILISTTSILFSQNCEYRIQVAEKYLSSNENPSDSLVAQISRTVKSCYSSSNSSKYVKGMLSLYGDNPDPTKAFTTLESAALEGHANSACMVGIMYKYGKGCGQDFKKAVHWFEKSAALGSSRALYSLGYMYFKGLGTNEQSYEKAAKFFEDSNYPMSQHWLAICKRYGLGTETDEDTANNLLQSNTVPNSKFLAGRWQIEDTNDFDGLTDNHSLDQKSKINDHIDIDDLEHIDSELYGGARTINTEGMAGSYVGKLIEMDWSRKGILAKTDVKIELEYNEDLDNFDFHLKDSGSVSVESNALYQENILYPDKLKFSLPYLYGDSNVLDSLEFRVNSLHFIQQKIKNQDYLVVTIDAWVDDLVEPAPPLLFVLSKDPFALSTDELNELADQSEDFIRLYPNPFEGELLIRYNLEKDGNTSVRLYDFRGMSIKNIIENTYQQSGEHTLRMQTNGIPSGQYIIKILTDTGTYTKLAVKK